MRLVGLINSRIFQGRYTIDRLAFDGYKWSRCGEIIVPEGGWEANHVTGPWLMRDGSEYVCYYSGFDEDARPQIGRARSSDLGAWHKDPRNPLITLGSAGDFDAAGANFPVVVHDDIWRMWYTGWAAGFVTTIGYAESSDGIAWMKHGQVLGLGSGFDSDGLASGAVIHRDGRWFLHYSGYSGRVYRPGLAVASHPAGPYRRLGVLNLAVEMDGITWQSLQVRSIVSNGSRSLVYGTAFHPDDKSYRESSFASSTHDPTLITGYETPSGPLVPLMGLVSAENPSIIEVAE